MRGRNESKSAVPFVITSSDRAVTFPVWGQATMTEPAELGIVGVTPGGVAYIDVPSETSDERQRVCLEPWRLAMLARYIATWRDEAAAGDERKGAP